MPLVLHGGSGIPSEQIKKAIENGIAKVNVNTELQLVNAKAIKEFVLSGKIDAGMEAVHKLLKEKFTEFGSINRIK